MKLVHWLLTLPLGLVLVVFAVSNLESVPVAFWPWSSLVVAPLYVVVLATLAVGFLAGEFVAWSNARRWRQEARRRARRIEALERELARTQAQLPPSETGRLPPAGPARD